MFGIDTTVLALMGLVGFALAALAYGLLYNRISADAARDKRVGRVAGPVQSKQSGRKADSAAARRKNVQETLKDIEIQQKHKASRSTDPPLRLRLVQAGLKITTTQFYLYSGIAGAMAALLALTRGLPPLLVLGIGFVAGAGLPRFYLNHVRNKRFAAFTEELPNAVEVIVRGVKAGLPLNDCLRMIAGEAREPVRSEFRTIVEAQAIGIPLDEAVAKMHERVPLPEANFFAIVISIQSKAGGNLSEALGNLARVLRDRKKMKAKIKAMSAEAKASATIIGSLPLVVMGLVYLTSPAYIEVLWLDPTGRVVLAGSAGMMGLGIYVMKKMISFDF